jgi:hypothetical protein
MRRDPNVQHSKIGTSNADDGGPTVPVRPDESEIVGRRGSDSGLIPLREL